MTLNKMIEAVKGHPQLFPDGLETKMVDAKRLLAVISVEPQTEDFAKASARVVALAENIDSKTFAEVSDVFGDALATLQELKNACKRAVNELNP